MASRVAVYTDQDGVNQNFLSVSVTTTGTVDEPELLVVKVVTGDDGMTVTTPTGGGLTYTRQIDYAPTSSARVAIFTAVDTSSQSFTLSVNFGGSANAGHSAAVERWQFAAVAASPVVVTANGSGSPTGSLTTTAPDSAVSWACGDWNAVDGSGRVYDASSEVPAEELYHFTSGSYTAYHAVQDTPSVRAHNFGLTAPTGQQYTLVGIEILDAGGAERLDPLPQGLTFKPPGRIAPRGSWSPLVGRDDPPPRNTPPGATFAQLASWQSSTTPQTLPSVSWGAGDIVVVVGVAADSSTTINTPTVAGLTFAANGQPSTGSSSCWVHKWTAVAGSAGSGTISISRTGNVNPFGAAVWVLSGSDGVGAAVAATPTVNVKTIPLGRVGTHSFVIEVFADWGAGATTGAAWTPSGSTATRINSDGGGATYSVLGTDWADQTPDGTFTYGLTAGLGAAQKIAGVALEILGTYIPAGGANAPAEAATGTGTASDAQVALGANDNGATGTGQATDPTASLGALDSGASGTGSALDAAVALTVADTGASGTGQAPDPTASLGVLDSGASGTGQALDATVSTANVTNAPAEVASGTGSAPDPTIAAGANDSGAAGTGTAPAPTPAVGALDSGASGTGQAPDGQVVIQVFDTGAAGTGTAYDATVSTAAQTSANAELASGTGTAPDPAIAVTVAAGLASGTGAAFDATVALGALAESVLGAGVAADPNTVITVPAGAASGTGSALDAVAQIGILVPAGLASGTGSAFDVSLALIALADTALGAGLAADATVQTVLPFTVGKLTPAAAATSTVTSDSAATTSLDTTIARGGPS